MKRVVDAINEINWERLADSEIVAEAKRHIVSVESFVPSEQRKTIQIATIADAFLDRLDIIINGGKR